MAKTKGVIMGGNATTESTVRFQAPTEGMTRDELLGLPVVVDIVTAGKAIGVGRSGAYDMAKRGTFPVRVLRLGNLYRVPRADLLRYLGEADVQAGAA